VTSELANNAVLHARSPFSVLVRPEQSGVRISVHDASPVAPRLLHLEPMAPSGRGLHLVSALADDWGFESTALQGKTVWAKLQAGKSGWAKLRHRPRC